MRPVQDPASPQLRPTCFSYTTSRLLWGHFANMGPFRFVSTVAAAAKRPLLLHSTATYLAPRLVHWRRRDEQQPRHSTRPRHGDDAAQVFAVLRNGRVLTRRVAAASAGAQRLRRLNSKVRVVACLWLAPHLTASRTAAHKVTSIYLQM